MKVYPHTPIEQADDTMYNILYGVICGSTLCMIICCLVILVIIFTVEEPDYSGSGD